MESPACRVGKICSSRLAEARHSQAIRGPLLSACEELWEQTSSRSPARARCVGVHAQLASRPPHLQPRPRGDGYLNRAACVQGSVSRHGSHGAPSPVRASDCEAPLHRAGAQLPGWAAICAWPAWPGGPDPVGGAWGARWGAH